VEATIEESANSTSAWYYHAGECRLQTEDKTVRDEMNEWPEARLVCWGHNCYLWVYQFASRFKGRISKKYNLTFSKS